MLNQSLARWIFGGNVAMFAVLAVLLVRGSPSRNPVEFSVQRLNIVDSTGAPRLVLASAGHLPGATFGGREYPRSFTGRERSAGMIFFNDVGDEVGGLVFEGAPRDSAWRAFGHFSFDQWKQSQVVALQYSDDGASRSAGLRVWDRPTDAPLEEQFDLALRMLAEPAGPARDSLDRERLRARSRVAGTQRLFAGSRDHNAVFELTDAAGRVRLRLSVDATGEARIDFLDSLGTPTATFP